MTIKVDPRAKNIDYWKCTKCEFFTRYKLDSRVHWRGNKECTGEFEFIKAKPTKEAIFASNLQYLLAYEDDTSPDVVKLINTILEYLESK